MKRSKIIAAIVASTVLALSLFVLAGCMSKSTATSDGNGIVVTLPASDNEVWTATPSAGGVVEVKGPEAAGEEAEFTISPVNDGTVDVEFTATRDGQKLESTATYNLQVKDGKVSETGHSEHFSGSF